MIQTIILPAPPSVNALRTVARGRVISSAVYRDWREAAGWAIRAGQLRPVTSYPVQVTITLRTLHRRDIDNVVKPLLDALVDVGILKDDDWAHVSRIIVQHEPVAHSSSVWVTVQENGHA